MKGYFKNRETGFLNDLKFNALMIVLIIFFALPVFYLVTSAFMTRIEIWGGAFFPSKFQWRNIYTVLVEYNMLHYFRNSLFFTIVIVLCNLFFCSLSGYALAKFNFPGKNLVFSLVLISMMVPSIILIVPLFIEIKAMGLLNTPWAMIVPWFIDPFGIFLMRQFMLDISEDHLNAARIEGANEFWIFLRIAIPFSMPALVALALYRFLYVWNDLFWPLLVIGGEKWRTLPVAITKFDAQYFEATELKMATAFIAALPILIILSVFSKKVFGAMSKTGGLKY